jgi:ribosomal protein S5
MTMIKVGDREGLVGLSAGAALLVVGAFWAGIHFAGRVR